MPQQDPSRTEKATPKRRNKARDEGNVPRSQELNKLMVLVVGLIMLRITFGMLWARMQGLMTGYLRSAPTTELRPQDVYTMFLDTTVNLAVMLLPTLFAICIAAVVINIVQFGRLWVPNVMSPKLDKLTNIAGGLKRLFLDPQTLIRLVKGLASTFAVGIAPYMILRSEARNMLPLFDQTPAAIAAHMVAISFKMTIYALLPMGIIAAADTGYTRWDYEENLKMTKDEVKDEAKQADGDPRVKAKQKQKMLAMSQRRMLANVAKADVVVTNPTHYAVALRYDPLKAPAPMVVAKGADHMAKRIREAAMENGVPMRENRPLARALYDQVEVGDIIPDTLYRAVATLLARLGKFKNKARRMVRPASPGEQT